MLKHRYLVIIIMLFSTTIYSQNQIQLNEESIAKANQILNDSRKTIGIEKININTFSLRTRITYDKRAGGMEESVNEIKVLPPDKIYSTVTRKQPFPTKIEYVWSGMAYKAISEIELLGERRIIDITDSSLNSKKFEGMSGKIEEQKIEKVKSYKKIDPKELFYANIWQIFFPITLVQPFEQKVEFKYVGKVKSANRVANVVDAKSQIGRNYRLLFDSETNHLLMLIETFKGRNGDNENKYYYSNREMVNNISIPKKIKVEEKFTPTGKEPRISYVNIDVLELNLNPEFKKNMFDVN